MTSTATRTNAAGRGDQAAAIGARHPVDLYVGDQMRKRRRTLLMSQAKLAEGLGITFQQVQKYESGLNRISASRLFETSELLDMPIADFFSGFSAPDATAPASFRG